MNNTEYGKLFGEVIVAPIGWEVVPEGEVIPSAHCEFIINPPFRDEIANKLKCDSPEWEKRWRAQWASPRRIHSTGTPPVAMKFGHVLAFARMKKVIARIWMNENEDSIIHIRDPREFIRKINELNSQNKSTYRIDEEVCNMFYGRSDYGIKEMIEKYNEIIPTLPKETYYYPPSNKAV